MNWNECLKQKLAKHAEKDESLINSLVKSSKNKLKSAELLPLDNDTAASKVSLAYDALREYLEACVLKKNYKIYNHECYACFFEK